ncbi:MAG: hypothetical protein IBX71_08355 [Candidatus Desulforudis sp.]|nr:hypothetical protein [Desulforudis sp.]
MFRYRCPECRTLYFSAALQDATNPWTCYLCGHVAVCLDTEEKPAAGRRDESLDTEREKVVGSGLSEG